MLTYLALEGSLANFEQIRSCQFITPHWQPDHHEVYCDGIIAMSATQRCITPQCQNGLMPYQDNTTGCIINADVYLTNHDTLCKLLEKDSQTADVVLLLLAYLKWGKECTHYLAGQFCFTVWDPRQQHIFAAVDQFALHPLFYAYQPGQFFLAANECSSFHSVCPQLTLNSQRFIEFANDAHSATETAYQEIHKLSSGHQLIITKSELRQTCYWSWKEQRQQLPYQTREQYYKALQQNFEQAVQKCLRYLGPLTTQISGGLDSSAVTAQAALLLAKEQLSLFAFTSTPNGLSGKSYRPGWYYHELPRIAEVLAKYPNIQHVIYTADPSTDIFERLKPLQRCFDQPLRNINNLDWTLACYEQVLKDEGRVLLIGAGGNGTISWDGGSRFDILKDFVHAIKAKLLHRNYLWKYNLHETMISSSLTAPLRASVYAFQLWYGVRRLDPTQDLDLTIFCYNVPQWVYRTGKDPLQQRLLTREGLSNLLPEDVTNNPYRGEQGADWYLHYNLHCKKWRDQMLLLTKPAQEILWQSYDQKKIMNMFNKYQYLAYPPNRIITNELSIQLLRCLSMGFYLS